MKIREIVKSDRDNFLVLQRQLDSETIYMAFEPEDRDYWAKNLDGIIEWALGNKSSNIFVVEEKDELVGFLQVSQHNLVRTKHIGTVFVGILQKNSRNGLGKKLFKNLLEWVKHTELKRLELTVLQENENAIALYKKMGFEIEGDKRRSFKIDGNFYDEYNMSKLL